MGGPTANMYGFECRKKLSRGRLRGQALPLPRRLPGAANSTTARSSSCCAACAQVPGIKKVFVASGIRYDLLLADQAHGRRTCKEMVEHHVSGQMKVAPEHTEDHVLASMGKPGQESAAASSKRMFDELSAEARQSRSS